MSAGVVVNGSDTPGMASVPTSSGCRFTKMRTAFAPADCPIESATSMV